MRIEPYNKVGSFKTGSLPSSITVERINRVLGFAPNVDDDPDKVEYSWSFLVDGEHCAIWDYRGVRWSTYGPSEIFFELFGFNDGQ